MEIDFIATNPEAMKMYVDDKASIKLTPQGYLIKKSNVDEPPNTAKGFAECNEKQNRRSVYYGAYPVLYRPLYEG